VTGAESPVNKSPQVNFARDGIVTVYLSTASVPVHYCGNLFLRRFFDAPKHTQLMIENPIHSIPKFFVLAILEQPKINRLQILCILKQNLLILVMH
jgi:hypothetical protein